MISVRYCHSHELSPGLNASVECSRRGTVVYLVPGLTRDERHSALRRLRMASRVGAGPELPAAQLALALLADRIRTAAWRAGAIFRLHPAGSALPVLLLSAGVVVFLALSAVSIQVLPEQAVPGPSPVRGPGPAATARGTGGIQERRPAFNPVNLVRAGSPGSRGGPAGSTRPGASSSHQGLGGQGSGGQGSGGQGSGGQGSGGQGSGSQDPGGGGGPTLAGSANPARTPGPVTGASSPAHAGTPNAAPSPSPSPPAGGGGGTCLQVGPLGVCLSL
jgi:hypothetical protein